MKKWMEFLRDRHEMLFKAFLLVFSISFLVYLLPREAKFRYEISNLAGKAWPYENLIAPFDFPILKDPDLVKKEKQEAISSALPVFRKENQGNKNAEDFRLAVSNGPLAEDLKPQEVNLLSALIDSVHRAGILLLPDSLAAKSTPETRIMVLTGNFAMENSVGEFFTIRTAADYLANRLPSGIRNRDEILDLMEDHLSHTILYDAETTEKFLRDALAQVSPTAGGIMKGQSIIDRGDLVTKDKVLALQSLKAEYEKQSGTSSSVLFILGGQSLAVVILLTLLAAFIILFRKDIYANTNKIFFILLLLLLMTLMTRITIHYDLLHYYLLPYCIIPVIIRTFYDTRLALFVHLVTILMISLMLPAPYEFLFIQFSAGTAAIFSIVSMRKRSQIFISSAVIFTSYCASYVAMSWLHDSGIQGLTTDHFISFVVSSSLTLFSYPLIYVFERSFGFVSDVTLLEISDTNSPLLRELASKAPGTFQHSLQVADIAEEIVREIGGNTLLARTGALYHDIGKMEMPLFFIENQTTQVNPHEDLDFEESARIIISHVIRGVERARKQGIPDVVIDFIRTHHGTTTTGFFFRSYRINNPEGTATEKDFQYPGPLPYSKETAAVMLADSVEASARAMKKHDSEALDEHVEHIVNGLISQHQFMNADITFRDITVIKKILKKKLGNIYHQRLEYPR
ncbi:MAG: HDIG domain-containing protein [Bacteroidia bacterium]|nr:HDIG domain-containing protein [Bacteroidia bacterium]